ncbi:MAG: ComF family protein [Ruminococcus sp.]|nr:ComF family protein [Ruminococcus sp.]
MNRIFDFIIHLFYPSRCAFCDKITDKEKVCCDECNSKINGVKPITTVLDNTFCVSAFPYCSVYRDAILNFKFKGRIQNADTLSLYMLKATREYYNDDKFDYITSVPLSKNQRNKRGFNQSEILARKIAEYLNVPYKECLEKIKDNEPQHSLNSDLRKLNVKGVYKSANEQITNLKILLVDDIVTTGCTLEECSRVLKKSKNNVLCCAFCKTE